MRTPSLIIHTLKMVTRLYCLFCIYYYDGTLLFVSPSLILLSSAISSIWKGQICTLVSYATLKTHNFMYNMFNQGWTNVVAQ